MRKISILIMLSLAQFVGAWGPMGHRIVAEVAYHYLSPEACQEVDEVLGIHGMVYWATWPDEIKSDIRIYPMSYNWHFQDLPANMTNEQVATMRMQYPQQGGLLWATIDQLMVQLTGHPEICTINAVDMSYHDALVYLIHLTADATCPMHIAHQEDKGGNLIKTTWFDSPTNLHMIWDEDLIASRGFSYTEYAQMLLDTYGTQVDSISNLSEKESAQYVYQTAQKIYDYQSKGDDNSYHYIWNWKAVCDRLLFEAGVRLANNIANIR